jgi:hypothetical protein
MTSGAPVGLTRRACLGAAGWTLAGCRGPSVESTEAPGWTARWVGATHERGHRLRGNDLPPPTLPARRCGVLVLGGGVAGLTAARRLIQAGVDDVHLLELEDSAGGNARGHQLGGQACPLGAHYLPLPGPSAWEVQALLEELGLLSRRHGRWVAHERHLCHSPQERLFYDGAWVEGLLPPAEAGSARLAQYRRLAQQVADARQRLGFALPSHRAGWTADHAALDGQTFAAWLDAQELHDPGLRWYLDYCCRDDYGADSRRVSAWAGLHYFASRHGFWAPGDEDGEREPVLTWPEGNAWITRRMALAIGDDRLHGGQTVLQVRAKHGPQAEVQVLAWDEALGAARPWTAQAAVLALPAHVAARVWADGPTALTALAAATPTAPWLVANLRLKAPLLERVGAVPAWDNVPFGSPGLGYVDAGHQDLRPDRPRTLLTAYRALPEGDRSALLTRSAQAWTQQLLDELGGLHPDLSRQLAEADLMRYGHAMAIPSPGLRGHPARPALRQLSGRLQWAHADLAGTSVFEEACAAGAEAAQRCLRALGRSTR